MIVRLILLFSIIPLIELMILIRIGTWLGALNTVLLVIATAIVGASLARRQGLATLWRIRQNLSMGKIPTEELLDGFLIIIAAIVLITPGILTDTFGLLLLIPVTRSWFKKLIRRRMGQWIDRNKGSYRIM